MTHEPLTFEGAQTPLQSFNLLAGEAREAIGGYPKRMFDAVVAGICLLCGMPVLLFIAIAIKLSDGGPVFYRDRRIGWNGTHFRCMKFRSMSVDSAALLRDYLQKNQAAALEWAQTRKLKSDPRVTRVGYLLRKSSLDELPQLINVLRGEMSLVGPRPICDQEVSMYGEVMQDYLRARPGLTGVWQVSGRNDVDYEKRTRLDREYIHTWNFWKDLWIILRTFRVVLSARGCY
jgi:exopolysaccharide production protein ExoY